jgi:hypothetical protein
MATAASTTNTSMTSRGAAYSVATPSAITGADSPMYAPRKKPASTSARDPDGAVLVRAGLGLAILPESMIVDAGLAGVPLRPTRLCRP